MSLINAGKLKSSIINLDLSATGGNHIQIQDIIRVIDESEPVDAKPVVHAHWIECGYNNDQMHTTIQDYVQCGGDANDWMPEHRYCSNCLNGHSWNDTIVEWTDFCPYCGAKMDEEVDDDVKAVFHSDHSKAKGTT